MPDPVLKESEFLRISRFVHDISGINLHIGKKELLKARLGKVIRHRHFRSFGEYYRHVVNDKSGHELTILLNAISTNLTHFFRESQHYDFLGKRAIPDLANTKASKGQNHLRFWSAGCSSGEEAYSIAIAVHEALDNSEKWQIRILATDLSTKVLAMARAGVYEKKKSRPYPTT